MKWIQSTGGPFVLISNELLDRWSGYYGDYDRACGIQDWLGVLDVGSGQALVLNDEPMQTTAWSAGDRTLLVRWHHATSEEAVVGQLERMISLDFPEPSIVVDFGSRSVVLCDSAVPGVDVDEDEILRLDLASARNEARTLDLVLDEETRLILHLLRSS